MPERIRLGDRAFDAIPAECIDTTMSPPERVIVLHDDANDLNMMKKVRLGQDMKYGPPWIILHHEEFPNTYELINCLALFDGLAMITHVVPPEWYDEDFRWIDSQREYLCRELQEIPHHLLLNK